VAQPYHWSNCDSFDFVFVLVFVLLVLVFVFVFVLVLVLDSTCYFLRVASNSWMWRFWNLLFTRERFAILHA
jgi:hypothetical protein